MAKKNNEFVEQEDLHLFTTSSGKQVKLSLFPPLQAQMVEEAARKEAIKLYGEAVRPTYHTEADEDLPHDESTLETDEDKAKWLAYQDLLTKHQTHVGNKMMRFVLYYGVDEKPDDEAEWQERQRYFGIEIPDDPIGRKIHYIQSELIYSAADVQEIMRRIMVLSGVRAEVIDAAAATFPDSARDGGA